MPQFDADGSDAAAPAYLALLAETYDAIKAVDPDVNVIGGALAPRGSDKAGGPRQTHSPTTFIEDMGAAYRASGRTKPVHGHVRDPSVPGELERPADIPHPNSTSIGLADYDKLVAAAARRVRHGAADRLRRVRHRDDRSRAAEAAYTGTEPRSIEAGRRRPRRRGATSRRSGSRRASRSCGCCSSSTSPTSRSSSGCRPASTTRTGRRSRPAPTSHRERSAGMPRRRSS